MIYDKQKSLEGRKEYDSMIYQSDELRYLLYHKNLCDRFHFYHVGILAKPSCSNEN